MTSYTPTTRCPSCRRAPNISFTEAEVQRAKRERQATRVVSVKCQRCGGSYWIRAREIAAAIPEAAPELPEDFPGRSDLMRANIHTLEQVGAIEDLTELPGIGPATARQITARLDAATQVAVA